MFDMPGRPDPILPENWSLASKAIDIARKELQRRGGLQAGDEVMCDDTTIRYRVVSIEDTTADIEKIGVITEHGLKEIVTVPLTSLYIYGDMIEILAELKENHSWDVGRN